MTVRPAARSGALALAITLLAGGCSGGTAATPAAAPSGPVTITNCGSDYTYDAAPQRIVTTSLPATELVLALGLGDKIVGTVPANGSELPEYSAALNAAPKIAEKAWPAPGREAVLGVNPDIVVSGYIDDYGKEALGDRTDLAAKGLNSYLLQGSCGDTPARTDDVLTDIDNLGRIFGVPARAAELRGKLAAQLGAPASAAPEPVKVFVYEGQEDKPLTDGKDALVNDLIARAGGVSIFPEQPSFGEVSWEEVIRRNPDVILIVEQGDFLNADKARSFLTSYAPLREVSAVKDQRFVAIGVTDLQPGVRNGTALETLRSGLAQ